MSARGKARLEDLARWARTVWVPLGLLSGTVALVWVAYLAGLEQGRRSRPERVSAVTNPATPAAGQQRIEPPAMVFASESRPEVWTRMAGLNVWIAGRRLAAKDEQPRIVIMLHGYGRPRESLLLLAEREADRYGTIFIFPEAPVAVDWHRRAWWRPQMSAVAVGLDPWPSIENPNRQPGAQTVMPDDDVVAARQLVTALIAEVRARFDADNDELLLAGFSQGATLALDVALHLEERLGGLVFLSGKPLDPDYAADMLPRLRGLPVLVAHGRDDQVAAFAPVDRLRRMLSAAGVELVWVPFDGGHLISPVAQRFLTWFIRRTRPGSVAESERAADGHNGRVAPSAVGRVETGVD